MRLQSSVSSKTLVIAHGVYYIHPRSRTIDRHDVSRLAWPESRAPTGCAAPHSMFRQPVCVLSPDPKGKRGFRPCHPERSRAWWPLSWQRPRMAPHGAHPCASLVRRPALLHAHALLCGNARCPLLEQDAQQLCNEVVLLLCDQKKRIFHTTIPQMKRNQ